MRIFYVYLKHLFEEKVKIIKNFKNNKSNFIVVPIAPTFLKLNEAAVESYFDVVKISKYF